MEQKKFIIVNEKGEKRFLHQCEDGSWAAFVGRDHGNYMKWKTLDKADKGLELKGWKRI